MQGTRGMTLLEVLAYVALLAVMTNLAASVFVDVMRLSKRGVGALDKIRCAQDLGADFTSAVRESCGIGHPADNRYVSGEQWLVLRTPPSSEHPDANRYIVLGPAATPTRLSKLVVIERKGETEVESQVTYPVDLDSIRFTYDPDAPSPLITLEAVPKKDPGTKLKPTPLKLYATPRAIWPSETSNEDTAR